MMRSRKTAAVTISVLLLSLFGMASTAKSATPEQAIHAIHEKYELETISDLEEGTQQEIICLALNQYHEARGSSEADIKAVGFSTRNRVRATESHSFCDAIWEKGQYVWTKRSVAGLLPKERAAWLRMIESAREIVTDDSLDDPTHGADSFYSRKIRPPQWAHRSPIRLVIGAHIYVRQRKT